MAIKRTKRQADKAAFNVALGSTIKRQRNSAAKSQAEVRTAAGLSAGCYSDVENGKRGIGLFHFLKLCEALNAPVGGVLRVTKLRIKKGDV